MRIYTHLSQEERALISHYHDNGISKRGISRLIGRHASSISKKLRGNGNCLNYKADIAANRSLSRRMRPCALDKDAALREYVLDRLGEGISPELISLRLQKFGHIEGIARES